MLVNLIVADRIAPRHRATGPEDEIIERYRDVRRAVRGTPARRSSRCSSRSSWARGVSAQWQQLDPVLELGRASASRTRSSTRTSASTCSACRSCSSRSGWTFAALLVVLIVTAVFHYLNGGIRLQSPFQRVTPQVKVHLSVILALDGADQDGAVLPGAVRADVVAPGLRRRRHLHRRARRSCRRCNLLMVISIAAAVLVHREHLPPGLGVPDHRGRAVGLHLDRRRHDLPGGASSASWCSRTSSRAKSRTSSATSARPAPRSASTKNSTTKHVRVRRRRSTRPTSSDNQATLDNVAALGPAPAQRRVQGRRRSSDRSTSSTTSTSIATRSAARRRSRRWSSVRELDFGPPPRQLVDEPAPRVHARLRRVVAAAANEVNGDQPSYLLAGHPADGRLDARPSTGRVLRRGPRRLRRRRHEGRRARGRDASGKTEATTYTGKARRARSSSFLRKAALALRFGDWNLFVSGQLTTKSRVLYIRDIRERVAHRRAVPEVRRRPVPGRPRRQASLWVLDAYTTSTGTRTRSRCTRRTCRPAAVSTPTFNYVRNSVKATVDAYDGTVNFYVVDANDPIIQAYRKAFPRAVRGRQARCRTGCGTHWRYPEDLFRAQTEQYALYHMTDPARVLPQAGPVGHRAEPRRAERGAGATATTAAATTAAATRHCRRPGSPITPLYLTMQLPGSDSGQEFVLQRSVRAAPKGEPLRVHRGAQRRRQLRQARRLRDPEQRRPRPRPRRRRRCIESDQVISSQFTLLDQRGSTVFRGDVQLLPIGNTIMYVRPIWVEGKGRRPSRASGSSPPRSEIARFSPATCPTRSRASSTTPHRRSAAAVRPNRRRPVRVRPPSSTSTTTSAPPTTPTTTAATGDETVAQLLQQASDELAAADQARQAGDLGAYQTHVTNARGLIDDANAKSAQGSTSTTPAPTTSTTGPVNT